MFSLLNKLIISKKVDFRKGEIWMLGTQVCLIPPDVYFEIIKDLEKTGNQQFIYDASLKSAKNWISKVIKSTKKKSKNEQIKLIPKLLELLALGKVELLEVDLDKNFFKVALYNSLTAELFGEHSSPVDFQFAGYLAGTFSFVLGIEMGCVENKCLSCGAERCEFIVTGGEKNV